MQHNNVFFSSADVDRYREKLKTDPAARARYEKYTQTVEKDLTEPYASWEEANDSDTQGGNFGVLHSQADRLSVSLGLKYLVEGDLRCAERFKGLLAHFIAFPRWYGVSYSTRKPVPWHSDLYSTAATLSFGRIYDLIFDTLTPAERGDLAQGILGKGVLPAFSDWVLPQKRIHALDSMGAQLVGSVHRGGGDRAACDQRPPAGGAGRRAAPRTRTARLRSF